MPPRDPDAWMWAQACALLDQADRLHRQFFQPGGLAGRRPVWEPPVDLFETEEELCIVVALPGVEPPDLQVAIEEGGLAVAGERRIPAECRSAAIRRLEIPYGRFERRIALPAGRYELGRRDLINGCLLLTLRRLQGAMR